MGEFVEGGRGEHGLWVWLRLPGQRATAGYALLLGTPGMLQAEFVNEWVCRWGWGRQLWSRQRYYNPSLATRFHVHAFSGPSFYYLENKSLWREWIGLALRAFAN